MNETDFLNLLCRIRHYGFWTWLKLEFGWTDRNLNFIQAACIVLTGLVFAGLFELALWLPRFLGVVVFGSVVFLVVLTLFLTNQVWFSKRRMASSIDITRHPRRRKHE
jgi:hypothetical protein